MYETNYRGIRYCFQEDCLVLNDKVIDYTLISNIRHRGGADPAFIFEYAGRQFAMPYPPNELAAILPYMKKASQMKPAPAAPEPAAPVVEPERVEELAAPVAEPESVEEPAAPEVPAEPEPAAPVAEPEPVEEPVAPVASEPAAPKKSKRKLFIILAAIVAALVIAVALVTLNGGGEEEYVDGDMQDSSVEMADDAEQDVTVPDVDPDATYDSIYDEYTARLKEEAPKLAEEYTNESANLATVEEKAQLSNDKISRLAEISNEGVEAMAEIMYANGDDYDVYEEWSMKLMNVYQEQAQLITDAYTDSAN